MGQGQGKEGPARALAALGALAAALACAAPALAQLNPFSVVGRAVTTAMDARTRAEVQADVEIAAGISKRLLDDKGSEWKGVTALVFAQHVVLAGAVKSAEVKKRVEEVARRDARIRSLGNELLVGDVGSLARDTALETEINAVLTAAKGVSSVNMRWSATGGNVVLMGIAGSPEESGIALAKVRAIKGVKSVRSHLRVVPPKK
jgi:osmotically-inducible protein OsmY